MDRQIMAIVVQEGGRFLSELLKSRPARRTPTGNLPLAVEQEQEERPIPEESLGDKEKAAQVATGCVPCAIGHFGTCSGLLAESLRFGKDEGIESGEVIERVNLCLDELNAMERVDLRPEKIVTLSSWEKKLANKALNESRTMRHALEGLTTVDDLEKVAATTQSVRQEIGREWFKQRLSQMPKEEKTKLAERAIERLERQA